MRPDERAGAIRYGTAVMRFTLRVRVLIQVAGISVRPKVRPKAFLRWRHLVKRSLDGAKRVSGTVKRPGPDERHRDSKCTFPRFKQTIMPAYVVIQIKINDPDAYARYKDLAPPSIAAYGGRYLLRGGSVTTLEGDWDPGRFVILEFPDRESAQSWWDSAEYAEAKALRHSSASSQMILADGRSFDPRAGASSN